MCSWIFSTNYHLTFISNSYSYTSTLRWARSIHLKLCSYVISCQPVESFHPLAASEQGSVLVCISPPSESWLYILLRCLSFKASDYRIDCWQWECFFLDDEVPSLRPAPFVRGEGDDMIYWLPPGITTAAWNWLWQWQRRLWKDFVVIPTWFLLSSRDWCWRAKCL